MFSGNVRGGALNLRQSMSSSSAQLKSIPNGTALTLYECGADDWFMTTYSGATGYVLAQYIAITNDGGVCRVTGSGSLNIRKTPATSAERIYSAASGTSLRLLDTNSVSGWYRVSGSNGTGWGMAQYLTVESYPSQASVLQFGDEGVAVLDLQNKLCSKHYYCVANGVFDEATERAVKYFQYLNGYEELTGIVDSAIINLLNDEGIIGVPGNVVNRGINGPAVDNIKMNTAMWALYPFDASSTTAVEYIGISGNAPVAICIAFSTIWEKAITPPHVADWAKINGYRDETATTGVTNAFFAAVANEFSMPYDGTTYSLDTLKNYIAQGGLGVARFTYDSAYPCCSVNGATYVVIYKVDDNYIYFENSNTNSITSIPVSEWDDGWIHEIHLYGVS